MNKINKPRCGQSKGNSGIPECDFLPGRIIGVVLTGNGREYAEKEAEDLIETLSKEAQGPLKTRVYPIFRFGTLTDNSEDPATESLGIGFTKTLNDGSYIWSMPLVNGAMYYAKCLRNFNGEKYNAFLVLDNGIMGVKTKSGKVRGFTMSRFYVNKPKWATDTTTTRFYVDMSFPNPSEFVDSYAYLQTDESIDYEIKGNLDYEIIQKTASAEKITVDIVSMSDRHSILDIYGDELAETSLWTGPTAVAYENGLLSFTGTFKSGDLIIPADVPELIKAGIGGYPSFGVDISPLTVEIP